MVITRKTYQKIIDTLKGDLGLEVRFTTRVVFINNLDCYKKMVADLSSMADEIVKNTLGVSQKPKYLPERPGDIKHSLADTGNMKNINMKIDSSNFEKQLVETINWFKEIL